MLIGTICRCILTRRGTYYSKRALFTSCLVQNKSVKTEITTKHYFQNRDKNKENFIAAINKFTEREKRLRGHVDFILSALKYLEEYGVHKDLEVYKKLIDLMPKGPMIPTNVFQQEFSHFPRQQECIVQVLDEMEKHGVVPDTEIGAILRNTFGNRSQPLFKYGRMRYWMPKFKNACPWPLPDVLPDDGFELSTMAVKQITSIDPTSKLTVYQTKSVRDAIDDTWIVSSISPAQESLLAKHPRNESLKIEGPFGVFLRDKRISYFILRSEPTPDPVPPLKVSEVDDVSSIFVWMMSDREEREKRQKEIAVTRSVHEQPDGNILAVCATGTSSRDSLLSWIRLLEESYPALKNIPVLFTQSSPVGDVIVSESQEGPGRLETSSIRDSVETEPSGS